MRGLVDMPVYTYECKNPKCKHVMEVLHKIDEKPDIKCEFCATATEKKILYTPNVVVPPQHQASPDKLKYHGIKNSKTGK